MSDSKVQATAARFAKAYTGFSLHLTNTLVLFVAINLFALVLDKACSPGPSTNVVAEKYNVDLGVYYPGKSKADINTLLQETWNRSLTFEPFTQFRDPVSRGRFVNVVRAGFRVGKRPAPWPPDPTHYNVFFFGGSTAFGVGLPDDETIPSALQDVLNRRAQSKPVTVYNFGRSNYYSSQERALFTRLLTGRAVPDAAIFLDGLNDFYYANDEPSFSEQFRSVTDSRFGSVVYGAWRLLPIARPLEDLTESLVGGQEVSATAAPDETAAVDRILARYAQNQRLIRAVAQEFDVKTFFIWQPVPTHGYDLSKHVFGRDGFGRHALSGPGYKRLRQRPFPDPESGRDFYWCDDADKNATWPHYLDIVHYTATMSSAIARCIVEQTKGQLLQNVGN